MRLIPQWEVSPSLQSLRLFRYPLEREAPPPATPPASCAERCLLPLGPRPRPRALRDFNFAIDKANAVNRQDLISLETLKAEIAFYDSIAQKIRLASAFTYEYNKEGGRDKIAMEFSLDQKAVLSHLESLRKKKEALEEQLANSNFKTEVDFDKRSIEKLL